MDEFADIQIDDEQEAIESEKKGSFIKTIAEKNIIKLKTNFIPKGLVPLERLFDNNDVFLKLESKTDGENTVD